MFCSSCGMALARQLKFCNHCGAQLLSVKDKSDRQATQKRLDEYLDGLFWITVFGLGLILGGIMLIKEGLHLSHGIMVGYLVLSVTVFLINFGLSLAEIARMRRSLKEEDAEPTEVKVPDTNKLAAAQEARALPEQSSLNEVASVTEDTTRSFEPVSREQAR